MSKTIGLNIGTESFTDLDTDNTLTGNSDSKVPSQKAIKAYVDGKFPVKDVVAHAVASGAIAVASGTVGLGSAGALAMTLATPTTPAQDGTRIFIVAETAHAHTVTTAANVIKNAGPASGDTLTFAHVGDSVELEAVAGLWYIRSLNGPALTEV